jgi:sugar phosphate isomerase/epimerase
MKEFGISTRLHQSEPLTVDLLERLHKANFRQIEIFGNRPHFDYHDRSRVRSVARWFEENEVPAPSLHLPFQEPYSRDRVLDLPLFAPEERLRQRAIDELKRCMELVEFTPLTYTVFHLGYPRQAFNPILFEYAYTVIATVQRLSGSKVLIENVISETSTVERILDFIAASQLQGVGVCYDVGHAFLHDAETVPFDRIDTIQLNDNDGRFDRHLWPFDGHLDWTGFVDKLTVSKFKGALLFEIADGDIGKHAAVTDRLNEMFFRAEESIEEFRLRYKIKISRNLDSEESE